MRLDVAGGHADMGDRQAKLYDVNGNLILIGRRQQLLYLLDAVTKHLLPQVNMITELPTWMEWHHRFGHIGIRGLQHTLDQDLVRGLIVNKDSPISDCEACIQAKQMRAPFPKAAETHAEKPSDLTHTNLWEHCAILGIGGTRYFVSMIDDTSRHITLAFIKSKDQAADKIKDYLVYIARQFGMVPKCV
ncbi:hypothetical protein ID866_13352 [Astraeus odoratus]|nr:hypothetical protein ID866_13352 [Astraeus odoratus]